MAGSDDTRIILEALQAGRMSAKERQTAVERSIREEARRLRTGGTAGAPLHPVQSPCSIAGRHIDCLHPTSACRRHFNQKTCSQQWSDAQGCSSVSYTAQLHRDARGNCCRAQLNAHD